MAENLDCEINILNFTQAILIFSGDKYEGTPKLENLQARLLDAAVDAQQYGTILFDALFPPDDNLLAGYRAALAIARHQEKNLRFILHIANQAPGEIHAYDWERLYDPKSKSALSRSKNTAFSRSLSLSENKQPAVEGPPKLLLIVSSPINIAQRGLADIDHNQIVQIIKNAVSSITDDVEVFEEPVTGGNIRRRLVQGKFDTVHIHAHAVLPIDGGTIRLVLENQSGKPHFIDENFLAEIFDGVATGLRLINLTACNSGSPVVSDAFSGLGQTLVRLGCPAVIAMRDAIGMDSAEIFTEHFYESLALTGQVDAAANEARRQLWLFNHESLEWSTPTVFTQLKGGQVWNPAQERLAQVIHNPGEIQLESILPFVHARKVVPIIGPDINRGQLLSNEQITEIWAEDNKYGQYNYPSNNRNDLPRVAGFLESMTPYPKSTHLNFLNILKNDLLEREKVQDRAPLKYLNLPDIISRMSNRHFERDADEPHRILAELPISTYLTTNPDGFMTEALKYVNKKAHREVCRWQEGDEEDDNYKALRGSGETPLIFHLYGSDQSHNSLVLTEDDYLDFLRLMSRDWWRIPAHIRATLTESLLLFLGYDVRDLDFRVLIKGVVEQLKKTSHTRIAVLQIEPGKNMQQKLHELKHLQKYLDSDCIKLKIVPCWLSVREFLVELRKKM